MKKKRVKERKQNQKNDKCDVGFEYGGGKLNTTLNEKEKEAEEAKNHVEKIHSTLTIMQRACMQRACMQRSLTQYSHQTCLHAEKRLCMRLKFGM